MEKLISKIDKIEGEIRVPSDKSISHRAIILTSLAKGKSQIKHFLKAGDTLTTLNCYKKLGIKIEEVSQTIHVYGQGLYGLSEPEDILDMGNSGTTTRLTMGVLSGQSFFSVMTGDESLKRRPMGRVGKPLTLMGAKIDGRNQGDNLPISIRGGKLTGIDYLNEKSSAQIKSSILLAGLYADSPTTVIEPIISRDHTEKMLAKMGADIHTEIHDNQYRVIIKPSDSLEPIQVDVPADPSSAAFFVAAATIVKDSNLILRDVLINPTREGFFKKIKQMGADIEYINMRENGGEIVADINVKSANLRGITITEEDIPSMVDEIPILAIIASQAEGETVIRGASELRVKESDRIKAIVNNLKTLGIQVEELEDGMIIRGPQKIKGGYVDSYKDHRIAMGFAILGLISQEGIKIKDADCVYISYPEFFNHLKSVSK